MQCLFEWKQFRTRAEFVDFSGFAAWSSSEDNDLDHFRSLDFSFAGHSGGKDGPGEDEFLLSEESIQRLRNATLKDPKSRKSLRRRRRPVTTHETLYRYIIATETTASHYLDTLSLITTGTWGKSGDFAKPSRYPCNLRTNVDEGLSVCCCCCFVLIASQISRLPCDFFIDLLLCFTNKNVHRLRLFLFMGI